MRLDPDYVTADQYALGTGESAIATERETPTDFEFTADEDQSIRKRAVIRVINPGTASATEDVTLTLARAFGGTDTTVAEETQSVTVAAGETATPEFFTADDSLQPGTYHVTVATSGTALTVCEVVGGHVEGFARKNRELDVFRVAESLWLVLHRPCAVCLFPTILVNQGIPVVLCLGGIAVYLHNRVCLMW